MHGFLIDGKTQAIESIEIGCAADIAQLIGHDTIISDEIDNKHSVFFDEDCFIRGTAGRFQIDKLAPIAGRAIVVGHAQGGKLHDVSLASGELHDRIAFM